LFDRLVVFSERVAGIVLFAGIALVAGIALLDPTSLTPALRKEVGKRS
jgi:hypothetical protein